VKLLGKAGHAIAALQGEQLAGCSVSMKPNPKYVGRRLPEMQKFLAMREKMFAEALG